jgi:hypothetical protein
MNPDLFNFANPVFKIALLHVGRVVMHMVVQMVWFSNVHMIKIMQLEMLKVSVLMPPGTLLAKIAM